MLLWDVAWIMFAICLFLFDLKIFLKVVGRCYWKVKVAREFFHEAVYFFNFGRGSSKRISWRCLRKIKTMCFWKFETWGVKILKTMQCFSFIFGCESWYFFHILFLINVSNVYLLFREKCVILFHVEICLVKNRLIFSVHFYLQINVKMRYYFLC